MVWFCSDTGGVTSYVNVYTDEQLTYVDFFKFQKYDWEVNLPLQYMVVISKLWGTFLQVYKQLLYCQDKL